MRQIGTIPRPDLAERFQDFLIASGRNCSLEDDVDGVAVWVHDDDDIPFAKAELVKFQSDPEAEIYRAARVRANEVLKAAAAKREAAIRNTVPLSRRWGTAAGAHAPVTIGVLIACVFVFVETFLLGDKRDIQAELFFSTDGTWKAVRDGQWWRVLSPAIMHGGPLHIFFNLMWWWDLGRPIEARKGSLTMLMMTLALAAFSNILQFHFGGPWFLGLSGVVFGVFGYTWVKGKLDPGDGIGISDQSAMWMMVWFIICAMGIAGRIANWAHFGGLALGMTLGCGSVAWRRLIRRGA